MRFDLTIEASTIINDVSTIDNIGQFSIAIGNLIKGDSGKSPYIDDTTKTWWEYNDTTKEYEDTGIAAKSVDIYNITNEIPLPAGQYYTLTTAIAAIPTTIRKLGLKITFQVSATNTETWEFFNGTIGNITNVAYWRKMSNDTSLLNTSSKDIVGGINELNETLMQKTEIDLITNSIVNIGKYVNNTGQYVTSASPDSIKSYIIKNNGYTNIKVKVATNSANVSPIAFFKTNDINSTSCISVINGINNNKGSWFNADIPQDCNYIVISNYNTWLENAIITIPSIINDNEDTLNSIINKTQEYNVLNLFSTISLKYVRYSDGVLVDTASNFKLYIIETSKLPSVVKIKAFCGDTTPSIVAFYNSPAFTTSSYIKTSSVQFDAESKFGKIITVNIPEGASHMIITNKEDLGDCYCGYNIPNYFIENINSINEKNTALNSIKIYNKNDVLNYINADAILKGTATSEEVGYAYRMVFYNVRLSNNVIIDSINWTNRHIALVLKKSGIIIYNSGWVDKATTINIYKFDYDSVEVIIGSLDYTNITIGDIQSLKLTITANAYQFIVSKKYLDENFNNLNPFKTDFHYGHLFIDKINGINVTIPCQSLFDVRVTARLGFKIIEANIQKTATNGKYIVTHGYSGAIGGTLFDPLGNDISTLRYKNLSYDTIRSYRYNSLYEKYRVCVSELKEFCIEAKLNGMTVLASAIDLDSANIVRSIFGNNWIQYGGNRKNTKHNGLLFTWGTTSRTKDEILNEAAIIGRPFMTAQDFSSWNDNDLFDLSQAMHDKGYLIGIAGCYETTSNMQRYLRAGFDFSASGWDINDGLIGNICSLDSGIDFTDFTHNGVVQSDESLLLTSGQTISLNTSSFPTPFLSGGILHIRYSGNISLDMGNYISNSIIQTSDGVITQRFSTYFLRMKPSFLITAINNTNIYELTFKADKC